MNCVSKRCIIPKYSHFWEQLNRMLNSNSNRTEILKIPLDEYPIIKIKTIYETQVLSFGGMVRTSHRINNN